MLKTNNRMISPWLVLTALVMGLCATPARTQDAPQLAGEVRLSVPIPADTASKVLLVEGGKPTWVAAGDSRAHAAGRIHRSVEADAPSLSVILVAQEPGVFAMLVGDGLAIVPLATGTLDPAIPTRVDVPLPPDGSYEPALLQLVISALDSAPDVIADGDWVEYSFKVQKSDGTQVCITIRINTKTRQAEITVDGEKTELFEVQVCDDGKTIKTKTTVWGITVEIVIRIDPETGKVTIEKPTGNDEYEIDPEEAQKLIEWLKNIKFKRKLSTEPDAAIVPGGGVQAK